MRNHFLRSSAGNIGENYVTDGLILHLDANKYSGSGDWLDETSNDHDGSISNATYVNDGNADYFDFDADDSVSFTGDGSSSYPNNVTGFPNRRLFSGFIDFSISIWFKTHAFPASTNWQISPILFAGGKRHIFLVHGDSPGDVDAISLRFQRAYSWVTACESPTLSLNTWYNYTITWDADGDIDGYLNGSASGISSGSVNWINGSSSGAWTDPMTLSAGGAGYSSSRNYDGQIALFSVYDKVLSSSEATQNYDAFKARFGY